MFYQDHFAADVRSYSDYYPFGMLVPNRHGNADVNGYRYGFQGQEKDDEIRDGEGNSLNYTFRMHDPRVGRFFAIDPLTKEYPHYSPYSFSGNKVIAFREREGLEEEAVAAFGGPVGWGYIAFKWAVIGYGAYVTVQTAEKVADDFKNAPSLETETETVTRIPKVVTVPKYESIPKNERNPKPNGRPRPKPVTPPVPPINSEDDDTITLYRGVSSDYRTSKSREMYAEAKLGMAIPNGLRDNFTGDAHDDADLHASGNNKSIFTSWTSDIDVAKNFAMGPKGEYPGIILKKEFKRSEIFPNISPTAKRLNEGEWLRPGIVTNAEKIKLTKKK